ncbi:MAG: hypothetical protein AAB403_18385 [Planctomycetota bacterium]
MVYDPTPFFDAFSPLRYLDLSSIYSQYASVVDFFLYLLIFVGLTQWVFESRFQGRGGRAVTIGVGTALAAGLSLAENRFGFSLLSFGPIAGFILVLLVAMVVYHVVHKTGLGALSSGLVALLVMYLGLGSFAPELLSWLGNTFPIIHLLAALAMLFLIGKVVFRLAEGIHTAKIPSLLPPIDPAAQEGLTKERQALSSSDPVIRDNRAVIEAIVHDLKDLYRYILQAGASPQALSHAREALHKARDREYVVVQTLDYLNTLDQKLRSYDLGLFHNLQAQYSTLPKPQKLAMQRSIDQERAKIYRELQLDEVAKRARNELTDYQASLQMVELALTHNEPERAAEILLRAIKSDQRLDRDLKRMQHAQHRLLRMIPSS